MAAHRLRRWPDIKHCVARYYRRRDIFYLFIMAQYGTFHYDQT